MTSVYDYGDERSLKATFTDETGSVTDPSTVTFQLRNPSGTVVTEVYNDPGSTVVKESTGVYSRKTLFNLSGQWIVRWAGAGVYDEAREEVIWVRPSAFE